LLPSLLSNTSHKLNMFSGFNLFGGGSKDKQKEKVVERDDRRLPLPSDFPEKGLFDTTGDPLVAKIVRPRKDVEKKLRVVCMSDTHTKHDRVKVPEGDILIHAGDFTNRGSISDIQRFSEFIGRQPHKYKIVIAGNHDRSFESAPLDAQKELKNCIYLQDSGIEIEGIKIWGSPWQPEFCNWAFNLDRGKPLKEKWDLIPNDTDILITHGPPYGYGDETTNKEKVGCDELLHAIKKRIHPKAHVCGHIHEAYGVEYDEDTTYINASICTFSYRATNPCIVFDI